MESIISEYVTSVIDAAMTMIFCLIVLRSRQRVRTPVLAAVIAALAILGSAFNLTAWAGSFIVTGCVFCPANPAGTKPRA